MTTILNGDCLEVLKTLPDESVHCVVTSPPYWGLRSYLPADHPDKHKEIGTEKTPEEYVAKLVAVFREVRRVLRSDGVCWLNLGSTYAANRSYQIPDSKHCDVGNNEGMSVPNGFKPKDLIPIPWMVAMALQKDGWWLRSDIIWSKPNCMPSSVTDRPTTSHEYVFLLAKSERYWYDAEAINEDASCYGKRITLGDKSFSKGQAKGANVSASGNGLADFYDVPKKRNRRSVWIIPTKSYREAHFATFPDKLIEPMILAGCPAGGTVLDPFGGSGTTGQVASRLGRKAILIELNPQYLPLVNQRTAQAGLNL